MQHVRLVIVGAMAVALGRSPAPAQTPPPDNPSPVVENLFACRGVTDAATRVACYDTAVAALQEARDRKQIVMLDREGVKKAKKSIFGFSLPKIRLFGGSDSDEPEVMEISGTLTRVQPEAYGRYSYFVDDGSVWRTIEEQPSAMPRKGQPITIKAALLGSYIAKVAKERSVKVMRIR